MNPDQTTVNRPFDLPALDVVLGSFVAAAKISTLTRAQLYQEFLPRLVACSGSFAAAVLSKRGTGPVGLIHQFGWEQLDSQSLPHIKASIKRVFQPEIVKSLTASRLTPISTFAAKTASIDEGEFVLALIRQRDPDPLVDQLLDDLVVEIVKEIEAYEFRRLAAKQPVVVQELTHLVQLTQNLAKTESLDQLGMHLVNDLARIAGADRVVFYNPAGKLLAVSGVASATQSDLTRTLSRIARITSTQRHPIESTVDQISVDDLPRPVELDSLLRQLDASRVYFAPIEIQGRCSGVISCEFFSLDSSPRDWVDQKKLIGRSIDFISPIVDRSAQIAAIPGFRSLNWLFNRVLVKPVRLIIGLSAFGLLAAALVYGLFMVQRPLEIQAEGRLQPQVTRHLYAPDDGNVATLLVSEGSRVKAGDLLLTLESQTINDQRIAIAGELAEIDKKLRNLMIADLQSGVAKTTQSLNQSIDQQAQAAAEMEQFKLRQATLEKRMLLLTERLDAMQVLAPIQGQVTTSDLEQRLTKRPVNRGDWLLSLSNLEEEWEIELHVPDSRIEFIQSAPQIEIKFKIIANSEQIFTGQLREIDFRTVAKDESSFRTVAVWVDIDESELAEHLRYGSRVIARIECGQRSNWFLLTYELRQKFREGWFW